MCLKIEKNLEAKVAKSDIRCYKLIKVHRYKHLVNQEPFYRTLYRDYIISIGKKYTSDITINRWDDYNDEIEEGLHSITNIKDACKLLKHETEHFGYDVHIVSCTIPKGSTYYRGTFGRGKWLKSYASDCVVYNEIIK